MKILKIKIKRTQSGGKTHYDYPLEYNASKIQVLCYESSLKENYDKVIARGNKEEYLIGVVEDVDVIGFLQSPDIVEITRDEALLLGNQWIKQVEIITDQDKILKILIKIANNKELIQQEKDAIDPAKPETGINKSKSFMESLNEYLAK